jgi:DNA gyrase subunit A
MEEGKERIIPVKIEDQMKSAYIDYSMSVIVARALPDVRDGLKPVHRRVLFGMYELGVLHNRAYKKSARIVGEVLGKYHPHGDTSVYDAMVRMAQPWSLRYPLVEGQGNFGSMDGDSPAAMRYTEARLTETAEDIISDIKKETVNFQSNFDDSLEEPMVLPSRIPNLIVNGASGIAVGMATNMLPHNLSEVVDGIIATIENPEMIAEDLFAYIKGPDFPTGGIIHGYEGIKEYLTTGKGRIVVRSKVEIEETDSGKDKIVITEIPYQVNKAALVAKIADLVNEGIIKGISNVNDESDRKGLRIVVDIKKDALAQVVLSQLFSYTLLQTSYTVNNTVLVDGRPDKLNMLQLINEFVKFRIEVIIRRTQFDLRKAEERAHILEGLIIALDNIDEVIKIIRSSETVAEASERLQSTFKLSEIQAKAILDMRLQKLVSLEMHKIQEEYQELMKTIEYLKSILESDELQKSIVKDELREIKEKYGDNRRTSIEFAEGEINIEDLIPNHKVVVTISHLGYIKRTNVEEYREQARGGKGSVGAKTRVSDFIEHMFIAKNHDYLLLFTQKGICHWLRVYEIPEGSKSSTGRVIRNMVNMSEDDKVKAYIPVKNLKDTSFLNSHYLIFGTLEGKIKKTPITAFSKPRINGIIAITINENDQLLEVKLTDGDNEIIVANDRGYAIRFHESSVRSMGRSAAGVKAMNLKGNSVVIGMITMKQEDNDKNVYVVSENGLGKRSLLDDYRITNRGGKGVKTMQITEKTGKLISIKSVGEFDSLIISTKNGVVIRTPISSMRIMGRATQGVKVINLDSSDMIADVAVIFNDNKDSIIEEE